jgi:uncharacterized protein with HEPN domain
MSRDPFLRLEDIIEACDRLRLYVENMNFESFDPDFKTQDAVIRVFEIIGEAVKSLPQDWTEREPEIPWRQIAGFRDVLAHAYFAVESSIVWEAAVEKAPLLKAACQRLLKS